MSGFPYLHDPGPWLTIIVAFGMVLFALLWWRLRTRLRRTDGLGQDWAGLRRADSNGAAGTLAVLTSERDEALANLAQLTAEIEAERYASAARQEVMNALLEAREAAEQADLRKTHFLAAASHDLRQPLQALGLFVSTLAQRPLSDDLRDIVSKIEGSLEALEHLLDTLLDISRLDAGVIEAHSVTFPLQSLFDRMALEFEPLAERKGLSIHLVRTTAKTRSDPALLERILRNLLSNAIRYTRKGGVVIGCRRRGGDLRVEVWDSGPGIAPADQREIFREFHQVGSTSNGQRQGLGLGLAIVDRLTALLSLQVELRSIVGRGSVFTIILPGADCRSHSTSVQSNLGVDAG